MDIIILILIAIFCAGMIVFIYWSLVDKHYKDVSEADRLSQRIKDAKDNGKKE